MKNGQSHESKLEIAKRVIARREELGLSQSELAENVPCSQMTVWRIETAAAYSPRLLRDVAATLKVRERWLLTGEEPRETAAPDTDPALLREERGHYFINKKVQLVPVVSWAQAGQGEIFFDPGWHIDEFRRVESPRDDLVGIIVKGDSMKPTYTEGDRVIIATALWAENGQTAVVKTKGYETMLKIYHERGADKVVLTSRNEKHKPITVDKADLIQACPVIAKFKP